MSLFDRLDSRRQALYLLTLVLCIAGIWEAWRLPSSIFPAVTFPRVKVIADAGEEPAAKIMPTVTRPLEQAVLRVPGIESVISTTSRGSTEIGAQFDWGTDMQVALQRVRAEVERVRPDLPPDARVESEWMNTAIFPILGYALTSDTASQADLWELAEYTLKPALIRIPGVSQIQVQGGRQREFRVTLNGAALSGHGLTAADVVSALNDDDRVESAGLVEANHELYLSLVDGRASSREAIGRIAVPVPGGGVPVAISALGEITVADAVSWIRTTAGGKPAVLLNVIRQPGGNTLEIAAAIDAVMGAKPALLPKNVQWNRFYDQAAFVRASVHGVRDAIVIGVALAALVLFLFLRDLRTTFVAVAILPVAMAILFLGLALTGQTVNLMPLGGIAAALGLVADDAIVVAENIHRREEEGAEHPAPSALARLFPALLGSSLSTIVIFTPFAILSGVAGAFFKPLALTMALSLTISLLLSLAVIPVLLHHWRARRREPDADAGAGAGRQSHSMLGARYDRLAAAFLDRPALAVVTLALLLGGAAAGYRVIGTDFLPEMDEGSIIMDYWTPPGTSLDETDATLRDVERIILSLRDVQTYSRRTGAQLGFFITEPNTGDYTIALKPRGERRPVDEVIDDLRARIEAAEPSLRVDFGQLLEDDISDLTGGEPQPLDVRVYGEDQAVLQQKAREVAKVLEGMHGVEDVFDGIVIAGPALDVKVKPDALARAGLTTASLHDQIEPALLGTIAGSVLLGEHVYDLRVLEPHPPGPNPLAGLKVRAPATGALLPLSAVAQVETGEPEAEIDRENLRTYLSVTARLSDGRDLGGAVAEARQRIHDAVPLPPGMSLRFAGLYEQQQSSFKALLGVLLAGLLLVSVITLFEFGDWRAPLLTAFVALASLAGVFAALLVTGMTLNISSFVGAIMMVGILGEKSVFTIHEGRLALREGLPVRDAWARTMRRRVRPVLMTIFATAFALAPLAFALGEGSQLQQPLAIAVIGGFIFSGPLALLVLPSLYRALDPNGTLGRR